MWDNTPSANVRQHVAVREGGGFVPITSVRKNHDALTLTVIADFTASIARLWEAYTDPRQLEKFWGPVEWPATFTRHDVYPGGQSHYFMTGPQGERSAGKWDFLGIHPGHSFEVRDAFAEEDGKEKADLPAMRVTFQFERTDEGSRLVTTTHFDSTEQLEQLTAMGMEEGLISAMSQIDGVLADTETFAATRATEAQVLSDTQVRITRVIRASMEQVWRAHHDAQLMQRWLLGPEGWTMPVCNIGERVGDTYRFEWEPEDGSQGRFGFTGKVLESVAPHREVTTEAMIDSDFEPTTNELTLIPMGDTTLLTLVITYPNSQVRDTVLSTGMTEGMETSYARLEQQLSGR